MLVTCELFISSEQLAYCTVYPFWSTSELYRLLFIAFSSQADISLGYCMMSPCQIYVRQWWCVPISDYSRIVVTFCNSGRNNSSQVIASFFAIKMPKDLVESKCQEVTMAQRNVRSGRDMEWNCILYPDPQRDFKSSPNRSFSGRLREGACPDCQAETWIGPEDFKPRWREEHKNSE